MERKSFFEIRNRLQFCKKNSKINYYQKGGERRARLPQDRDHHGGAGAGEFPAVRGEALYRACREFRRHLFGRGQ